MPVEHTIDA
jgi:aminopeptidase N